MKKIYLLLILFSFSVIGGLQAQQIYTAYNLWYQNPQKVFAINYKVGKILPAGSEVTDVKIKKGRGAHLAFTVKNTRQKFKVFYSQKYHGSVTIDKFRNRMFTKKTFAELTSDLTPIEIEAIKAGKAQTGMSKKAIAICVGLPPEHKTPTLKSNTWLYWSSRARKFAITFDENGRSLPKGSKPGSKTGTNLASSKKAPPKTPTFMNTSNTGPVADTTPPIIVINEPAVTRGMRIAQKKIMVRGTAIDDSGVFEVLINGVEATLSADGGFWAEVLLAVGENQIRVRARDIKNNVADQTFTILRDGGDAAVPAVSGTDAGGIGLGSGEYYALIIAVEDYQNQSINDLDEPIRDAKILQKTLTSRYIFDPGNVILLENPSREMIISEFDRLSREITLHDNLLIFYAGHGYWDEKFQQGYWLPSNASRDNRIKWISNSTIVDFIRGIETTHTLLITDACFSGGIFKTRKAFSDAPPAVTELYKLPSRKAMTSGTLKEVPDKSVFVEYLTKRLESNVEKYLTSEQLFTSFRTAVINNSPVNQIPQFGEIRQSGDEGGDFIFIKR